MPLPPALAALQDQYREIFRQVTVTGELDHAAGVQAVRTLGVVDAAGARWSISTDQGPETPLFLRAAPGGPSVPSDPSAFADGEWPATDGGTGWGTGGWTDQADELLAPPSRGGPAPAPTPWDGPNQGFPDDVVVGEPVATGWDPWEQGVAGAGTMGTGPGESSPVAGPRRRRGAGRALGSVGSWFQGPDSGKRRTAVIAVACVICLVLFLLTRGGGGDAPEAVGFSYNCPKLEVVIEGASGDAAVLLGCLDGNSDPVSADRGPQVAEFAVERGADGVVRYTPEREVTRATVLHTSMRLYTFAGGAAPVTSTPVDLSGLPQNQVQSVQAAVSLGVVPAEGLDPGAGATRGFGAVVLYRALTRAGVIPDARGQEVPSDAPAGEPELGRAVTALRQTGIVDGEVSAPFGYNDPLLVADWVVWSGRAAHEIREPGSMARRVGEPSTTTTVAQRPTVPGTAPAPAPAPAPGGADGPGPDRVAAVISSITSGDVALIDQVVEGAGQGGVLNAAMWAGLDDLGLQVRAQAPASVQGDRAVQVWEAVGANNTVQAEFQVNWVRTGDGTWDLAGWPES